MKLIIVRHGQTYMNARKIHQRPSSRLTPRGIEQSKKVALRLKSVRLDAIFSSSLLRSQQTAKEIAKFHRGVPVIADARIDERNIGIYRGKPHGIFDKEVKRLGVDRYAYRPEGGESFDDVSARVRSFVHDLCGTWQGKTVVVVGHGGSIKALLENILHIDRPRLLTMAIENTAVTMLDVQDKKCVIELLNCTEHLHEAYR